MHFGKDKYLPNFVRMWASALKVNRLCSNSGFATERLFGFGKIMKTL